MKAWNRRKIKYRKCKLINKIFDFDDMRSKFGFQIEVKEETYPSIDDYFSPDFVTFVSVKTKNNYVFSFVKEDILSKIETLEYFGFNFKLSNEFIKKYQKNEN